MAKPSKYAQESLHQMYKDLTDDEVIAENIRREDRREHIKNKKADTGL